MTRLNLFTISPAAAKVTGWTNEEMLGAIATKISILTTNGCSRNGKGDIGKPWKSDWCEIPDAA